MRICCQAAAASLTQQLGCVLRATVANDVSGRLRISWACHPKVFILVAARGRPKAARAPPESANLVRESPLGLYLGRRAWAAEARWSAREPSVTQLQKIYDNFQGATVAKLCELWPQASLALNLVSASTVRPTTVASLPADLDDASSQLQRPVCRFLNRLKSSFRCLTYLKFI